METGECECPLHQPAGKYWKCYARTPKVKLKKNPYLVYPVYLSKLAHNLVKMGVKGGPPFLFDEAQVVLAEEWKIQKGEACLLNPTWT